MQHSVTEMGRAVRRRLERVVHKSRDKDYARRALAILHLWESEGNVAQAADRVRAARSSVYRWQSSFGQRPYLELPSLERRLGSVPYVERYP